MPDEEACGYRRRPTDRWASVRRRTIAATRVCATQIARLLLELIARRFPGPRHRGGSVVEEGARPRSVARVGPVAQVAVEPIVPQLSGAIHSAAAAPVVDLPDRGPPAERERVRLEVDGREQIGSRLPGETDRAGAGVLDDA